MKFIAHGMECDDLGLGAGFRHFIETSLNGGIDPECYRTQKTHCHECKTVFTVEWNEARGFCEKEEFYCPVCGPPLVVVGTVSASDIPRTFMA